LCVSVGFGVCFVAQHFVVFLLHCRSSFWSICVSGCEEDGFDEDDLL
jgi:hypothetical protein